MAIRLTSKDYETLYALVNQLSEINWGCWPNSNTWPLLKTGYTIVQIGDKGVLVNFDEPVEFNQQRSRRWTRNISRANMPKGAARFLKPI